MAGGVEADELLVVEHVHGVALVDVGELAEASPPVPHADFGSRTQPGAAVEAVAVELGLVLPGAVVRDGDGHLGDLGFSLGEGGRHRVVGDFDRVAARLRGLGRRLCLSLLLLGQVGEEHGGRARGGGHAITS